MITDRQVGLLRKKLMEGKTLETAAASAGMCEGTARTWLEEGLLPSQAKVVRHWRTRPDPFVEVWEVDVLPLLRADSDGKLQAQTVMEELRRRHPEDGFEEGQVRTLQRRMRVWRALSGPEKEVFFPQEHVAGREGAFDFTCANELGITIQGQAFDHLLFEFALSYSGWFTSSIAFAETFEALSMGLQGALFELGGRPTVVRSDNLSAATHELKLSAGRGLTARYAELLGHYGLQSTRIQPGKAHENGVAEQRHHRTKTALDQALRLRSHRDFGGQEEYGVFMRAVVAAERAKRWARFEEERVLLQPLPSRPLPCHTIFTPRVTCWSTVRVGGRTYSVSSRLIGEEVEARQHPDVVQIYYAGTLVETMPRLRGDKQVKIDYRHVIWSLVKKPGAFARYRYREELFPTLVFRQAYDALRHRTERADVEYVRILHLAASTMECRVEQALETLLQSGEAFDYARVTAIVQPKRPEHPVVNIPAPDLRRYDRLLAMGGGR
jgi:hypothetical protein